MRHPPKPPGPGPQGRGSTGRPAPSRPLARPATIAQRPQFDLVPEPVRAARQHFVDAFGAPSKALAFGQPGAAGGLRSVDVGLFGERPAPLVLASAGASALACGDGTRREWVLILKESPPDAMFSFLADIAAAGAAAGTVLTTDALAPFHAVLLLDARALPTERRSLERKDGVRVEVGWVIPVFKQEASFAEAQGAEALFSHWQQHKPDLTDLRRKPSVPSA